MITTGQRYLNEDGTINWEFLKRGVFRAGAGLTGRELEVTAVFSEVFNRYHNVKFLLAKWGEYTITQEDLAQQEAARRTSAILQRECEERYRRRSAHGRGRRTTSR